MVHKINYPNYATCYSAIIKGIKCGDAPKFSSCFGSSLTKFSYANSLKVNYSIYLYRGFQALDKNMNNYCWMTQHQLENYLRRIASLYPFKYKVVPDEDTFRIDLEIVGTIKPVTFVLQCIKRCYEFPFNFYLLQAYKMQELPEFRFTSILNLFNTIFSTFDSFNYYYDHCFSGRNYFESYKTIRDRIPHVLYVTDLYPTKARGTKVAPVTVNPEISRGNLKGTAPNIIEQWDECFEKFLPFYIKNYKVLKKKP